MRIAILGDIHANADALDAVLAHLEQHRIDKIYHTGDIVGYCTDFQPVIERMRSLGIEGVVGNHEQMLLGELGIDDASPGARQAILWSRPTLTDTDREFLQALPDRIQNRKMILFHATPDSLVNRIRDVRQAHSAWRNLGRPESWQVGIHGHVHAQRVFEIRNGSTVLAGRGEGEYRLDPHCHYIVCPGSVGVSRDVDPRSAYMIYDTNGRIRMFRVEYPWRRTRKKLRRAGVQTPLYVTRWKKTKYRSREHLSTLIRFVKRLLHR